jgi:hypothetical protein
VDAVDENGRIPLRLASQKGQAGGTQCNYALQDYQMQLKLLEQQNKKRSKIIVTI